MISRTRGTPIMEEIAIIKIIGRLVSKIEFITVVALTALALVTVVGVGEGAADDDGVAAGMMLEIFCKAFVALVNAAVVFSKALVVFSNLSLTISEVAIPAVALVVVLLLVVNPPPVIVVVLKGSVALAVGEEEEVVAAALSKDKLSMSMNNRDTRITTAVTEFIYTLFVLFTA
jgi:hypothetical protein